jgi:hypothetical protein
MSTLNTEQTTNQRLLVKLIILQEDKIILIVPIYSVHYSCYASYCIVLEMEEIKYLYLYLYLYYQGQRLKIAAVVRGVSEERYCKDF